MTRVLLPRPAGSDADAALLERAGVEVVADPYLEIMPLLDEATMAARRELAALLPEAALVITSARALSSLIDFCEVDRAAIVYAIGATSAKAATAAGFSDVRTPDDGADNLALTRRITRDEPSVLVIPRSSAAPVSFVDDLRALGIEVHAAVLYATTPVVEPPPSVQSLASGDFDAVILRSGSAARAVAGFVPQWPASTRIVAAGRATALVLRELGLPVAAIATHPDSATVVATALRTIGGSHD